ncbi:MAG TPA: hypothetical protein VGK22_01410 [Candidatus Angelobacter sp.]
MADLIVVVEPDYTTRLESTAQNAPLWIVASQQNKSACERIWKSNPHIDHRENGAITSYKISNPENRLENLSGIIPDLQLHHGEIQNSEPSFPSGFVLEVIGLPLADNVAEALREFGFTSFIRTTEGFQACTL